MFFIKKSKITILPQRWKSILILSLFCISLSFANQNERPKIGLVLSGGGAKGFAHIGTLKMQDSLQIPIDYIVSDRKHLNLQKKHHNANFEIA